MERASFLRTEARMPYLTTFLNQMLDEVRGLMSCAVADILSFVQQGDYFVTSCLTRKLAWIFKLILWPIVVAMCRPCVTTAVKAPGTIL